MNVFCMAFAMGGSLRKQTSSGGGWCIRSYGEVAITSNKYEYKLKFKKRKKVPEWYKFL